MTVIATVVKLTVFGAGGPVGQRLVDQAVSRGHEVTAVVQSTTPESRFGDTVQVIEADVYAGDDIETALEDATVVCNLLSHSKSTPSDYITVTGQYILTAMDSVGVDRYFTVVPTAVRCENDRRGVGEAIINTLYRLLRPTMVADAEDHVRAVTASALDWTVIRVLRLTDGDLTRQYKTGHIKLGIGGVSRSDVASFILDCCERGIYVRMQPKIRT